MTCKTCKYWERYGWPDDLWGRCLRTKTTKNSSEDKDTLAWVESVGKYHAWLTVRETFGCVQFVSRVQE